MLKFMEPALMKLVPETLRETVWAMKSPLLLLVDEYGGNGKWYRPSRALRCVHPADQPHSDLDIDVTAADFKLQLAAVRDEDGDRQMILRVPHNRPVFLRHEGRYSLHVTRALNIYRGGKVLFVMEGKILVGPTDDAGKLFSFVCNMDSTYAWNAHEIATAIPSDGAMFDLMIESRERAGAVRQRVIEDSIDRYSAAFEDEECTHDKAIKGLDVRLVCDVKKKLLRPRPYAEQRDTLIYKFSKGE